MSQEYTTNEHLDLIDKILHEKGTLEQMEGWLARLKEIVPYFESSDFMLQLETSLEAKRQAYEHSRRVGPKLSKEQLVVLVERLRTGVGTDVEQEVWLTLVRHNVSHPEVLGLIYNPSRHGLGRNPTSEEIVDAMLSYKPILLGPATSEPADTSPKNDTEPE